MYLVNATIINDGPIENFELQAPFTEANLPKPIVLVGSNGSGKTTFMSILGDALVEMSASVFTDVAPLQGNGRAWYRVVGNKNQRTGSSFGVSALRFRIKENFQYYRVKSGNVLSDDLKEQMAIYSGMANWPEDGNYKDVQCNGDDIKQIFLSGCCAFFPVNRHEIPHWLNVNFSNDRDEGFNFQSRFSDKMDRSVIVDRAIDKIKPWILDVVLDQAVDAGQILAADTVEKVRDQIIPRLTSNQTLGNINTILQTILGKDNARVVRTHRNQRSNRLAIAFGDSVAIPSFDHLSAGQATLFTIFSTIIQYADKGNANKSVLLQNIEGIVLIDEVDAHLHADLQYKALPKLVKMFPKVQFIMTTHAPLFLLGMKNEFGDDGFKILEMPSGLTIDAERFSEFQHSFNCYKETKAFEEIIKELAAKDNKPLLLTEGELDVNYMKAAIEVLGFSDLLNKIEIDWVGRTQEGQTFNGGSTALDKAYTTLKHNPALTKRRVILLYDCDTKKQNESDGFLSIIGLPESVNTKVKHGIENMFPQSVFMEEYYTQKTEPLSDGGEKSIKSLDKNKLRNFLCGEGKTENNYKNFRPVIEMIRSLIGNE